MDRTATTRRVASPAASAGGIVSRALWLGANALQALFTGTWSAVWITAALVVFAVTRHRRLPLTMARRIWAPGLLAGGRCRLEVQGVERVAACGPCCFVFNHQSLMDVPVAFAALPVPLHFIVKQELRRVPLLGWYIAAMGMIFVERSQRLGSMASVRRAATVLAAGGSIASFPEGTRDGGGRIRPFKLGVFVLAIEAGVPVVPVAIHGTGRVLPPGGFRARPGTIRVAVGEPLPTAGLTAAARLDLARSAHARVADLYRSLAEAACSAAEPVEARP